MKIILSRKCFDSSEGKVASPIFPSGRLCPLPIPTKYYGSQYQDIQFLDTTLGPIVYSLTNGKMSPSAKAHLDPDLNIKSLPRKKDWRPLFGQTGAAQGHLMNQKVGKGDIFLFYGWFKHIELNDGNYQYVKEAQDLHVIFGWLQVEQVIPSNIKNAPSWAAYHPHFNRPQSYENDSVYVASRQITLPGYSLSIPGGGVFPHFHPSLCLTASQQTRSVWKLPSWFYPLNRKSALTYHTNLKRWQLFEEYVLLQCVGRGQEFVLNCDHYPEAVSWLASILNLYKQ